MGDIQELMVRIEGFFNKGPGLSSLRALRDGSVMEFLVDDKSFTFKKEGGKAVVILGKPEKTNFAVRFTMEALEDMLNAKDSYDLRRRVWQQRRRGAIKFIPLRDDVGREYFLFGYHYWARRLGIIYS
ncbi:MAG: hypothetical protein QXS79_04525 [Candidatus Bathyarchaeia archaeon]